MNSTAPLSRSVLKIGWRQLKRTPWQTLLMVLGITLGVGVMVAIDLANESASTAFDLSTQALTGKATHTIQASSDGLDEEIYTTLALAGLPYPHAPLITTQVSSPQLGDIPMQLLGIDPFAEPPFRSYLGQNRQDLSLLALTEFLTKPGSVLISTGLAAQYGIQAEDEITLQIGGQPQTVTVIGLIEPVDDLSRRALNGIILADIATVQELTGRTGTIDRIDLILPEDSAQAVEQIEALLPPGAIVQPNAARSGAITQMTAAFRTNLTALSLLALVVGVFLIYNTMTFSVVQRRPVFGTLRALGMTRQEIFRMVMLEAFVIGLIGAALGVGLGLVMGQGAVRLVTQTINDLFFVLTVQEVAIPTGSILKGMLIGIAATTLAAAPPAWEAANVAPRQALLRSGLEQKAQTMIKAAGWLGIVLILAGVGILLIPSRSIVLGFAGTFGVMIGFALLTPTATRLLMRLTENTFNRRPNALLRLAPRQVTGALSRTSIAIAALMIAISVSIGVNLMIGSFRYTVIAWMEQILSGDIYIGPPGSNLSLTDLTISPEVLDTLQGWPGVEQLAVLRSVTVESPYGPITVGANNNPLDGQEQFYVWVDGKPMEAWAKVQQGAVLVSEPLARRLGLPLEGGELTLYTDRGPHTFPITGIYYDYSSAAGGMIMWLDQYRTYWDDDKLTAVSIKLAPGVDADQTALDIQAAVTPIQSLLVRPNRELRADTLEIFDRTFAITSALQILTTLVAFIGVVSAMLSLQLEKQRQLGLLRALGLTIRQLWQLVLLETGLMGAVAGLVAMPTGYALSLILVYIINRRSFGWTLQMAALPEPFLQAMFVAVLAALLAGLYPAWRVSRRVTADALRFE